MAQQNQQKELQALIEAITVSHPELKERLNVAAIWSFLQLPDSSFGWANNGDMPKAAKCLAIATSLQLGLMPGMGQLYYLGNKLYVAGEGLRHIAHSTAGFSLGDRKIRPLTNDENLMLDVTPGDRALAIEQKISYGGREITVTGFGILERAELDAKGSNGKPMPGRGSKKDIYQTLVTRAERDIYKHHLPLRGVSVGLEPGEIIDVDVEHEKTDREMMAKRIADVVSDETLERKKSILDKAKREIFDLLDRASAQNVKLDVELSKKDVDDMDNLDDLSATYSMILDAIDQVERKEKSYVAEESTKKKSTKTKLTTPEEISPKQTAVEEVKKSAPETKTFLNIQDQKIYDYVCETCNRPEIKNGLKALFIELRDCITDLDSWDRQSLAIAMREAHDGKTEKLVDMIKKLKTPKKID